MIVRQNDKTEINHKPISSEQYKTDIGVMGRK
jgi:hypothetical protein